MTALTVGVTGTTELAARFEQASLTVGAQAFDITRRYGLLAQTKVRANMSGRSGVDYVPGESDTSDAPGGEIGPRAITGDLRRTVTMEMSATAAAAGGQVVASVFSNAPQVLRLELGFVGEDDLGRHYDQPPYPAWRPAFDALQGDYHREIAALADLR